ncbi:DNA methyltransferase 1-associated protein DMAP1 [Phyllosticta capitalensis]|uniref:SWR1-complex protein 4 n=1 Tax=Phyllosticta capitalensis TaxID=121624 RepID=A0ABR1YB40_9PEZI
MASMNDARDLMGLQPGEALPKPPPAKKQKMANSKRVTGINREVQALYGERAPPVSVVEAGKSYQPKRRWGANKGPAARWVMRPFTNPARDDGLVLRHWRRMQPDGMGAARDANGDVAMENNGDADAAPAPDADPLLETSYEFSKFNIQPEGPEYDEETYEAHLRSDDWTKEETDYLVETVKDYYHRWAVIADRYGYQPKQPDVKPEDGSTAPPAVQAKPRTMEDMKARYYQISAKLMELKTPIASMTNAEFHLHEILTKFDPDREKQRKKVAAALLERSADEIREEQYLLAELQRINTNYEKLAAEREEVRQRLSAPQSQGNTSAAQFQSSAALTSLFNQLLQQSRSSKRNGRLALAANAAQRDSISSAANAAGGNKRASLTSTQQTTAQQSQPPRQLTPRAMSRLGVTHHDRLSSGVTFKSDRLLKLRTAKSTIQTQKIQAALAELGIPELICLPTANVCDAFDGLVNKIHKMLDLRKLLEKEEAEVAVAEGIRRERLRREAEARGEASSSIPQVDGAGDDGGGGNEVKQQQQQQNPANADADADGSPDDGGQGQQSVPPPADGNGGGEGDVAEKGG